MGIGTPGCVVNSTIGAVHIHTRRGGLSRAIVAHTSNHGPSAAVRDQSETAMRLLPTAAEGEENGHLIGCESGV